MYFPGKHKYYSGHVITHVILYFIQDMKETEPPAAQISMSVNVDYITVVLTLSATMRREDSDVNVSMVSWTRKRG